ncbi:MAG: DUF1684 domain-containing protein, partial [Bacteroidia bacterium]|nr:DUF1684 domain-containing protein [Bacteroidia bacterium]
MKYKLTFTICLLFAIGITSCAQETTTGNAYIDKIESERAEKDEEFKGEESILMEGDIKKFKGLEYFEVDETYKVVATFEKIEDGRVFEMKTSTARLPVYKTYAKLTFQLDGKDYQLFAYQNQK